MADDLPAPTGDLVAKGAKLELLFTRTANIKGGLTEGPAAAPDGTIYFTDISQGEDKSYIHHYDPATGKTSVFTDNSMKANGLEFDLNGHLLACEGSDYGGRAVVRYDLKTKNRTVLTDKFNGKRYNAPNDLTIDKKGRIYFTDPRYGDRASIEMKDSTGREIEGVYRIDPDGKVTRIIDKELQRPNGIVITPDDRHLFVADNHNNEVGASRKLYRFDLAADGSVVANSRKVIFDWGNSRGPDGMELDQAGRLFVAGGLNKPNPPFETIDRKGGVYVLSQEGVLLEFIPIPNDEVTNVAFGGDDWKTLFVTAGGTLWSVRVNTPGRSPLAPAKTE